MAASADPDYVELELAREAMTLEYLTVAACEELGVEADQVPTKSTSKYFTLSKGGRQILLCGFQGSLLFPKI